MNQIQDKLYTKEFWLLCISSGLFMGSFNMIIPELPDYFRSLGGGDYIGLIISLFTLSAGLSRPFSGILTDKLGRIPVMIIGSSVCVITSLAYPFVSTVSGFLILRLLHGFSTGFKPTGAVAYLADIVPIEKRGEAMGVVGLAGSIGMSLGPYLGSEIKLSYGMNILFYTSSFVALLSVLTLIGLKESLPEREKFSTKWFSLKEIFYFEKPVIAPAVVMFLYIASFGIVLILVPDKSILVGFENKGLYFGVQVLISMFVRLFAGKSSDKHGRINILLIGMLFLTVGMSIVAFSTDKYTMLLGGVFNGIAVGLSAPTIFAWTVDKASDHKRAQGMGIMYIAMEFGILFSSLIAGQIISFYPNSINYVFLSGAIFSILAFFYLIKLKKR